MPLWAVNLGGYIVGLPFGGGLYMGPIVSWIQDFLRIKKYLWLKKLYLGGGQKLIFGESKLILGEKNILVG